MKKFTLLLLLLFNAHLSIFNLQWSTVNVMANDGVYYTSGNFLVPLRETDIAVKKEVLEITLCRDSFATVTVDYTLYNNSEDKRVTMAFEAAAPYNAWVPINRQGSHPFIEDFTVLFNGEKLTYRNALVEAHTINSSFEEKGSRKDCLMPLDPNEWKGYGEVADSLLPMDDVLVNPALPDSFRTYAYAYYFDAPFRKGENRVRHTYRYRMSWGVGRDYELSYWLTPITRWRGGQVDDFTLRIKSETDREIIMNDSLFLGAPFKLEGIGDIYQLQSDYWGYSQCLFAPLMEGNVLEWHGTNFAPTENLHIEPLYLPFELLDDYFIEAQDYGLVPKAEAKVEFREATKGQGFVYLNSDIRRANVRREPSMKSKVLFTLDNDGELPEGYPCLGFVSHQEPNGFYKWWYKVNVNGKTGYISEEIANWDSIQL